MPDVEDYEWDKPQYDDGALERYVRSLTNQKLLFAPGERVQYSNMAFEVLGDVVAKASGESFDDYVQRHILAHPGAPPDDGQYPLPETGESDAVDVGSRIGRGGCAVSQSSLSL